MLGKNNNALMRWLLVLNVIALVLLGFRHLQMVMKDRAERRKNAEAAATILSTMEHLTHGEALALMQTSDRLEHGGGLSETELDHWLGQLKINDGLPVDKSAGRRNAICNVLREAVKYNVLSSSQREEFANATIAALALDDPRNEIGQDVLDAALTTSEIKDTQALPMLRRYLNDPRPVVRHGVREAVMKLEAIPEGRAAK